jgi:hypothetical protein
VNGASGLNSAAGTAGSAGAAYDTGADIWGAYDAGVYDVAAGAGSGT